MILIPEQVRNIRQEIKTRSNENDYFDTNYQNRKNLEELLDNYEYLNERCLDSIAVGTRFKIIFEDDYETPEEFTLVDTLDGVNAKDGFVSSLSPLGQAVTGLKEEEEAYYEVPRGKMKIKVLSIEKDKNKYLSMLRSVNASYRICRKEKQDLNYLLNNDLEEYKKRFYITSSQRQLLIQELTKLERNLNLANKDKSYSRINAIKKCLKENKIATLETDKIGIGSQFTIKFIIDDEEQEMHLELINRAVSTEYPGEYLERISALGSKVYGLKENDMFIFKGPNGKNISGMVYNIKNNNVNISNLTYTK
jgi:transcription elongation GreA/GreB family factor